jgi:hypothetical protein
MIKKLLSLVILTAISLSMLLLSSCGTHSPKTRGDLLLSVSSSDNKFTVNMYSYSGGATVSSTLTGYLVNNQTKSEKLIYQCYGQIYAVVKWVNDFEVQINAAFLDVRTDTYNGNDKEDMPKFSKSYDGVEFITSYQSPSKDKAISIYYYYPSLWNQSDMVVLGELLDFKTKNKTDIYWNYIKSSENIEVDWVDNDSVKINGIILNVMKDVFDCRKQQ